MNDRLNTPMGNTWLRLGRCKICGDFVAVNDGDVCPACQRHMIMSGVKQ